MKFQDIKPYVGLDFIKLYTNLDDVKTKEDALGYIGDIISKLLSVLDTYRSEMLLFNA